ncbi:ABC transporter substrate-binding protein [Aestuariimicrobium sp. T2.26MG-19.2B]|uniref:ABC transporter substrate-binding protein n=1 Tax=Aestuariimicrobium sp. T2.26MG-19.2B TaxID=3040679 RepID=UPI0024775C6D|nr:ABC transporter substrate-binding protein [Aestuariimicrobium sp. T2.26MG-19.2B]CAI9399324.1 hypothetical protein AESSP_00168 [Aestuariimicrobium sp. T2.26MG-19.2B]
MSLNLSRRAVLATLSVGALAGTAACAGQGGAKPGGSGTSATSGSSASKVATNDGVITLASGGPTYPKNFNWYGANQNGTAPGLNLIYESPFALDYTKPGHFIPMLAESYEMEDDGSTMVFHLRKGVKWSDGVEMTADDFAYTLGFINGDACPDPEKCWAKKPPEATDKYTCKVYFNDAEYQQMASYAMYYPIIPAHVWKSKDRKTDTNDKPVGTGPCTLESFDPQLVTYTWREDYWGGKGNGVKTVKFKPMGPIGGVESQLDRGDLDLAEGTAPGIEKDFVAKNPELNHFSVYPSGGSQIITFNCLKAPFNDVAVRTALRGSLDLQAAADLAATGYTVPSVTGLDPQVYSDTLLPDYKQAQKADVEGAKKALADAGWTVVDGHLSKGGKAHPIALVLDNSNQVWMQLGQVLIDQWMKALGVKVAWQPTPTQVFNDKAVKGEYDMFAAGGVSSGNYYQAFAQYSKSNWQPIGTKENVWGNYGRWQNKAMQDNVKKMSDFRSDDAEGLKPLIEAMQKAVADDAPFIPVMTNAQGVLWSSRKWTGFPEPGATAYLPGVGGVNHSILTLLNLKPA